MKKLLFALPFLLFTFSCSEPEIGVVTTVNIKGKRIPKINIDAVTFELHQIGISELISDYKVIPLETRDECLVSNTLITCNDNMLLIGTQHFPDPAPVYQFDMEGRFIKEIGKAGNGPGEHNNYLVVSIQILPEKEIIKIDFETQIQLFDYNGEYIDEIEQPYDLMGDAYYLSDDRWFSPGLAAVPPNYARDSVIIVIHDMEGSIMHIIPRLKYPTGIGYTPTGWGPSVYRYNNCWNIYMPGLDTVYSLHNNELEVETILDLGQKRQAYNKTIDPVKVPGTYTFSVVSENSNHWLINGREITEAEIREYKPGFWSGRYNTREELLIINKKGDKSKRIEVTDNLFGLADTKMMNSLSRTIDNDKIVYSLQSSKIKQQISDILASSELNSDIKQRLSELDKLITEDSNPVVFIYYLKDKFDLY